MYFIFDVFYCWRIVKLKKQFEKETINIIQIF